ncbi:SDR family NAD(P)-dependent oxidoreductase [Listeria grandensis]|uniref:SDR family NAD(P)-dependent oxidoreductase n=1 Tax=Listeria grandensis TaxID=1494963 RepID=UPI00162952A7|nr:SDR family NAD(P)-dependent oxidoreductase [Listeria grandensis]MBC1474397.1 SDR family NAD(P)-dependent oxidoreductase [Listeria grandensis]
MKTILVTGGAGFIGSHVCEMYLKNKYKVVCVDNLSSGLESNLSQCFKNTDFTFINADIRDENTLNEIFLEYKLDIINHHAAQKSVGDSVDNPLYDLDINGKGLLNLLMLTKQYPIEKFIYISSGGALSKDIQGEEKSKESDTPQLVSPYAITKFAGEKYVELYSKLNKFEYTALRYANVYGPRQIPDGECGVIPIFVENVLKEQPSVLMTYEDMPRGCTRDYVHILDVVDANLYATEEPANMTINIGSGIEYPILDIYKKIIKAFEKNVPIEVSGPRLGDIKRSVLDPSLAYRTWKWQVSISLDEGIVSLADYYCIK